MLRILCGEMWVCYVFFPWVQFTTELPVQEHTFLIQKLRVPRSSQTQILSALLCLNLYFVSYPPKQANIFSRRKWILKHFAP